MIVETAPAACLTKPPLAWHLLYDGYPEKVAVITGEAAWRELSRRRARSGGGASARRRVARFSTSFHIGRDASCEVQVAEVQVSRRHAEVSRQRGEWIIRDLQSSNGLFADGERVETAAIRGSVSVTLGAGGPTIEISPEQVAAAPPAMSPPAASDPGASLDDYAQRYFGSDDDDEPVGGRTMMIRKAYQQVQQQQKRRHRSVIAVWRCWAGGGRMRALSAPRHRRAATDR